MWRCFDDGVRVGGFDYLVHTKEFLILPLLFILRWHSQHSGTRLVLVSTSCRDAQPWSPDGVRHSLHSGKGSYLGWENDGRRRMHQSMFKAISLQRKLQRVARDMPGDVPCVKCANFANVPAAVPSDPSPLQGQKCGLNPRLIGDAATQKLCGERDSTTLSLAVFPFLQQVDLFPDNESVAEHRVSGARL